MRYVLAAVALTLAVAAPARAADNAEALLADLAAHQTHGWASLQGGIDYPQMEATIAAGGHVYVPCGVIAMLAKRALDRAGVPNRLVGAFSNTPGGLYDVPVGTLESHALIEVWEDDRWVLYDLDGNVKAVDENGDGIGIREFAQAPRRYETLATDPLFDLAGSPNPVYEQWLFDNHEAWYDRVLDTLAVMPYRGKVYLFTDPTLKAVLDPMPGYQWVTEPTWRQAVAAAPTTPAPTSSVAAKPTAEPPAAPSPVSAPAPVLAPGRTPTVRPAKACRRLKRKYKRTHSRRVLRKYRRCRRLERHPDQLHADPLEDRVQLR